VALDADEVSAIGTLVGAVAWPVVVLLVAWMFRGALRDVVSRAEEFSLSGPAGMSITAKRQAAATQALVRASEAKSGAPAPSRGTLRREVEETSRAVVDLGRPPRVLWVDDRPSNNRYEVAAFESLGMAVELSPSTEDALSKITDSRQFDVIISDMGRPPDPRAGYTLLRNLRSRGDRTPFIIYAASRKPEHFDEAVGQGALGCTNRPKELIAMVLSALRSSPLSE
jgi:CheY-like chemotaxis protein